MAKLAFINVVLLSIVSCGFTLTLNDFLAFGNLRQIQQEEPRVVEIIRWRQPVCLTAAPGVLPCMVSLGNSQPNNQVHEHYSKKTSDDDLLKKLTQDDSLHDSSSLESLEKDDSLSKRSVRATSTPKLVSPKVVKSVQLENMGPSSLQDPASQSARRGKYLRLAPQMTKSAARRQTVYVTKVVDSPIMANLVAATCLPDIGIPHCDEIQESHQNPGNSHYNPQPENHGIPNPALVPAVQPSHGYPGSVPGAQYPYGYPASVPGAQPPYGYPAPIGPIHSSNNGQNSNNNNGQQQTQQSTQAPPPQFIQNIVDFLNPPNVVQTNQTPEVKPVIVVQPTSPPGIFDGINAFLMPNGSLFGVFNRPADNGSQTGGNGTGGGFPGIPGLPQFPQLPQLPQIPQLPNIPSLQEILYRPENDISNPSVLDVFNITNNRPGAGPATQSPGIFGGLFASPARPDGFYNSSTTTTTTTTTTAAPSILDGINNIFRPTNRPLIIESPNQRPIVVEKPVYVAELPVIPGLFDILQNPNRPVQVDSSKEPQVIKDPVYVLQRPNQGPQLFGVGLPNFFGAPSSTTPSTTTSTTTAPTPAVYHHPDYTQLPAFPNPSVVNPGKNYDDSSVITENSASYENSKSPGIASSQGYTVSIDAVEISSPSSVSTEVDSQKYQTTEETVLVENDLLNGSLTEIVNAEGGTLTTTITDQSHIVEDVSDTSLQVREDKPHYDRYRNIENFGIKENIDNEA